jgi:RNase P subunit RPR2
LAQLEAGGDPHRPIGVESASQVEPAALSNACLRCDGPLRLEEHAAVVVDGQRLRVARLVCSRCGARRQIWFRLDRPLAN